MPTKVKKADRKPLREGPAPIPWMVDRSHRRTDALDLTGKQTGRNVHPGAPLLLIIRSQDTGKSETKQTNDKAKSHGPSRSAKMICGQEMKSAPKGSPQLVVRQMLQRAARQAKSRRGNQTTASACEY
jgi:hypothetical protein